jgi:hypothetical protein
MAAATASSIFQSFQPLFTLLKLFGLAPFEINVSALTVNETKSPLYPAGFIAMYICALVVATALGQSESSTEESFFLRYGNHLMYLLYILNMAAAVAFNYFKRKEIVACIVVMHQFDCMLLLLQVGRARCSVMIIENRKIIFSPHKKNQKEGNNKSKSTKSRAINHPRHRRMVSSFIVNGFVLLVVKISSSLCNLREQEWNFAFVYSISMKAVGYELAALTCYQLVFFSYCVKCRYKVLVERFIEHFRFARRSSSSEKDEDIDNLMFLHSQLEKALELINETFSKMVSSCHM